MIIDSLTMLEGVGGTSKIIGVGVKGGFLRFFIFFGGGGVLKVSVSQGLI